MRSLRIWLYNLFFVIALPIGLIAWARYAHVSLAPASLTVAVPLLTAGAALLAWAIASFILETGKAPSNADPPDQRVTGGPYAIFSDPIYVGFALAVFGAAAWFGSASGFWLVAPATALAAAALVFGHEALRRPPLKDERQRSLTSLPEGAEESPSLHQRFGAALQILAWFAALELLAIASGGGAELRPTELPWIVLAAAAPFVMRLSTVWDLRRMLIGIHVTLLIGGAAFAGPVHITAGLVPSAFVSAATVGAWLAAYALHRAIWRQRLYLFALAGAGVLLTLVPLAEETRVALTVAVLAAAALPTHGIALRTAEAIANSWSAVRLGPVRIINYAGYAFAAAALGALIFFAVVGERGLAAALIIAICVVVSAGVWGQLVEFSGKLARPFGYYGALIGAFLGVGVAAPITGASPWLLGAGLALGAPVVQAIGRLRCLVQGCCHGACVHAHARGIVYRRAESRVLRIAKLGGRPIHPTPLYSIYANALTMLVLWRLLEAGAAQTQLIAVYLILSGLLRFIEEAYRGEPQTPVWKGLRLYQWLAIGQTLAGVGMSLVPSAPMPTLTSPDAWTLAVSVAVGVIAGAAMGVDFPSARRRFSQLTPTDLSDA